jgi:hypothetical protein
LAAIERSELKLPASTAISSDGSIVIAPHKVVYRLREDIDSETYGRILLREDGREMLNRYQVYTPVPNLIVPPGQGVITTCSMYLNEHYVVLQSGFALGRNLPATVLDPIKTRGIRIYLEIINGTPHTIVNPLISARIYGAPKDRSTERRKSSVRNHELYPEGTQDFRTPPGERQTTTCHFIAKPAAVIDSGQEITQAQVFANGPMRSPAPSHGPAVRIGPRGFFQAQPVPAHVCHLAAAPGHRGAAGGSGAQIFSQPGRTSRYHQSGGRR